MCTYINTYIQADRRMYIIYMHTYTYINTYIHAYIHLYRPFVIT